MKNGNLLYEIKYHVTVDEYTLFNQDIAAETLSKKQKSSMWLGIIEMIAAVIFFIILLTQKRMDNFSLYLILTVVLFCMGGYSYSFFKYIFPRNLIKAAKNQYKKNDYLKNEIHVELGDESVIEESGDYTNEVLWEDIFGFKQTKHFYQIMLTEQNCILLNKKNPDVMEIKEELEQIFDELAKQYNKPLVGFEK